MASSEKVDAWMPLWIGSYLADTMHLTRDQHGGYLLLLFAYWRNKGPLIDDAEELASIAKATPAEWKKLGPRLARFFTVDDGHWSHTRADKELETAGLRRAAAQSKAKAAAEARWGKSKEECSKHAPSMPEALHEDMRDECPTPSPSSTLRSEEKKMPPRKRDTAPEVTRPDDVAEQVWKDWVQLRKDKRAKVSLTAIEGAREEAAKAGMGLEAFLRIWCRRGSQGLEADWIKPNERAATATGETAHQRAVRERANEISPLTARRAPGHITIEEARNVPVLASH